jgi:hypothetical protein
VFKKQIFAIVFVLMLLFAAPVNAQTDIRKVDFKNFTYVIGDLSDENKMKVTVKNGEFFRDKEDDKLYFSVQSIEYGDINGDGQDEAIVTTAYNSGGTGTFSDGFVFTLKNGKPVVLTGFEGGDRADGGLVSAKVSDGILIVERNSPGEFGGSCCPQVIETTRYKWNGKRLAQVGKTESRELYPATRISFKRGSSMSVFDVSIPKGEIKRFVIGARSGQTLRISSNAKPAKNIFYRLVRGDGEEKETANGLNVKLNKNGDYVFDLSNNTEKDLSVSVMVEIN